MEKESEQLNEKLKELNQHKALQYLPLSLWNPEFEEHKKALDDYDRKKKQELSAEEYKKYKKDEDK